MSHYVVLLKLDLDLGNCDIDFFNFRHSKVQNFQISNLFERNWNFAVIFWKYRKRNRKSTKSYTTKISWNVISFVKSH
jgi:hypothetical protein